MTSHPDGPSALEQYTSRIKELYRSCGSPRSSLVDAVARRLEEFYPLQHGRSTLPTSVGRSTLSQVVNATRLPSAEMLAVIVLSLQRCGQENGSLAADREPEDLQTWQRLLRQAKAEAAARKARSAAQSRGRRPEVTDRTTTGENAGTDEEQPGPTSTEGLGRTAAPGAGPAQRPADAVAATPRPARRHGRADPVVLEQRELAELARHGTYATALTGPAGHGDSDAIYQIAVILSGHPDHAHKAVSYLLNAAAAGHELANELIPLDGDRVDSQSALLHARVLARAAERNRDHDAACTFRACASHHELRPGARPGT